MKIKPKNWDSFQQYKDRKPTWIKFHRDLLNDFVYSSVQIGTKATLPLLWLLASEYNDGIIDASIEEISFRIHIDSNIVKMAIEELLSTGFFICLDENVQDCTDLYKMVPREEKRREEKNKSISTNIDFNKEILTIPTNELNEKHFSLSKPSLFRDAPSEYLETLERYINSYVDKLEIEININGGNLSKVLKWDDFYLGAYNYEKKYVNFAMTYHAWARRSK